MPRSERSVSRDAILEAVVRVVARDGLTGASLSAIARDAGTSKPLVLYHFGSRRALFREMAQRVLDRLQTAMYERVTSLDGDEDRLRSALAVVFDKENRTLLAGVHAVKSLGAQDPEIGGCVRRFFDQLSRMTAMMMGSTATIEDGEALVVALQGHIDLWLCSGDEDPGRYIDGALRVTRAMLGQVTPGPESLE